MIYFFSLGSVIREDSDITSSFQLAFYLMPAKKLTLNHLCRRHVKLTSLFVSLGDRFWADMMQQGRVVGGLGHQRLEGTVFVGSYVSSASMRTVDQDTHLLWLYDKF